MRQCEVGQCGEAAPASRGLMFRHLMGGAMPGADAATASNPNRPAPHIIAPPNRPPFFGYFCASTRRAPVIPDS